LELKKAAEDAAFRYKIKAIWGRLEFEAPL